jgi:Core-2/I-Branching enzyme
VPFRRPSKMQRSFRRTLPLVKVAYAICSHTNPDQVVRLASLLASSDRDAVVAVHHDQTSTRLDRRSLPDTPSVHLLDSGIDVRWAGFSVVEMVLFCMRWIRDHTAFDWFVLLSGQDYPIQPLQSIAAFLDRTEHDAFARGLPIDQLEGWRRREAERRYLYAYTKVPVPRPLIRRGASEPLRGFGGARPGAGGAGGGASAGRYRPHRSPLTVKVSPGERAVYVGVRRRRTVFGPSLVPYRGGLWLTASARAVDAVGRFVDRNPEFVRYYRRVWIPDESFFPTILGNDRSLRVFPDHLRYIEFPPGGGLHPRTLTTADLDAMLGSDRQFARKFDTRVDAAVLDVLDDRVHRPKGAAGSGSPAR